MSTVAAIDAVACPKCGGEMYNNRASKKNPAQPDFKCRRYKEGCEGVIWPPRNTKAPAPKIAPRSGSNVPDSELPEFLRDAAAQDAAEMAARVSAADDPRKAKQEAYAAAQYQSVKIALEVIVPLYEAKQIGMTDDVIHKHAFELFKTWCDKGLIG